jgi:hypothetical protein
MDFLDTLKAKISELDEKQFYTYVISFFVVLVLIILLLMFYYFRSSKSLNKQIRDLNMIRATQIKEILTKADRLKLQKEKLDALLIQDPDFKLTEYLERVIAQVGLSERKDVVQVPQTTDVNEHYIESSIEFTLNDINMKQLVDFLVAVENNRRVFIKKLEITKSKTTANSLEVHILIATLFLKSA